MASEEAARSHLSPRKHRRSPHDDDDAEDGASSPKRHKRGHHRHCHRVSPAAADPAEGEAEDGEILDQATAAVGVGVGRGLDADAGETGSVQGVLPAPVCSKPPIHFVAVGYRLFSLPLDPLFRSS